MTHGSQQMPVVLSGSSVMSRAATEQPGAEAADAMYAFMRCNGIGDVIRRQL
jgi:hypothetical protein